MRKTMAEFKEHAKKQRPMVVEMLKKGVPLAQISRELDVSANFIYTVRDKEGLTPTSCELKSPKSKIPDWLWKQWDDFINSLKHPISIKIK